MQIGLKLTNDELLALQIASRSHLAFSLTEKCPLFCSNCIMSSGVSSTIIEKFDTKASLYIAKQMPLLKNIGIARVSFTGGEPILAKRQMEILSRAAKRSGISTSVVTSGYFSKTIHAASKMVENLSDIDDWHISTDLYHQEYVPEEYVINLVNAVVNAGKRAVIRMMVSRPPAEREIEIYDSLKKKIKEDIPIFVQPIVIGGRAKKIYDEPFNKESKMSMPCNTNGIVIRSDGSVSPCCSSLISQRTGHPFKYNNAFKNSLVEIHKAWADDALLKVLQSVGFTPLLAWIREFAPDHPVLDLNPMHPCDFCINLWKYPGISDFLRKKMSQPENIKKANLLYDQIFNNKERIDNDL